VCLIQPIHKFSISFLHRACLFPPVACRLFSLNEADHYRTHCLACASELEQKSSDLPTLTCKNKDCSKRYVIMSRESVAEASCVDPQFELCDEPAEEEFVSDSVLSIGSPGPIDVVSSEGTHRIVDGGASAHESIVLRTRSSTPFFSDSGADKSPLSTTTEGVDDMLRRTFLVQASSSTIKAGLVDQPSASTPEHAVSHDHADANLLHAEEVLDYLRSFAVNEDSPFLPYLHSPTKPLPVVAVRAIIHRAQQLLAEEPRVLTVSEDVRVFSDIHGNFKDLLVWQRLFWPDGVAALEGSVLWLGDYVDRGLNSVEVVLYMLAQKVPTRIASLFAHSLFAAADAGMFFADPPRPRPAHR
jgi:hypothetical protein